MKKTGIGKNTSSKKKSTGKKAKKDMMQVNLRNVKLSKESRKALRKIKDPTWGNVMNAIESGNWHIPSNTYEFADIKSKFEKSMYSFFGLPKDTLVEVDYFESDILSFEKGIYPKWPK